MQRPIDASLVVTQEQGENQPHITALCYKTSRVFCCLFVCFWFSFLLFFELWGRFTFWATIQVVFALPEMQLAVPWSNSSLLALADIWHSWRTK